MWYCAFCFVRRATTDLQFFEAQHVVSIVLQAGKQAKIDETVKMDKSRAVTDSSKWLS
jgi:hypothetical protein